MDATVIEDLVSVARSRLIKFGISKLTSEFLAISFISKIPTFWMGPLMFFVNPLIKWAVVKLIDNAEFGLFVMNAKVLTQDQAKDYVKDELYVRSLPDDVSNEIWIAAEEKANKSFDNMVRYSA